MSREERGGFEVLRTPFPLVRKIHRKLDPAESGAAYVWDIDKTWLDTRFSQLKGMLKIPFEFAVDKRSIPGTKELLHALRDGPSGREHRPLYFITASPPFIRRAIERKMLLDGVEFDGILYKDQLEVARRRHFDSLREHTPFKLSALLLLAQEFGPGIRMYLFGDDAESDASIYRLFADICSGKTRGPALERELLRRGVRAEYARQVAALADEIEPRERVGAIYIHLVRDPSGASVAEHGSAVFGYPRARLAADHLLANGLISEAARDRIPAG